MEALSWVRLGCWNSDLHIRDFDIVFWGALLFGAGIHAEEITRCIDMIHPFNQLMNSTLYLTQTYILPPPSPSSSPPSTYHYNDCQPSLQPLKRSTDIHSCIYIPRRTTAAEGVPGWIGREARWEGTREESNVLRERR